MISRISGKIIKRKEFSFLIDVHGLGYEVFVPVGIMKGISKNEDEVEFVTYHYNQMDSSKTIPVLIGFLNEIEKEFFEKFITVSGIGPKAAVKAISVPIPEIADAIDGADINFLKALPGIGPQRAKEIVAKLQGKVGKFGLIKDKTEKVISAISEKSSMAEEAIAVLMQLEYRHKEAGHMVSYALQQNPNINNVEELLNEVYRQKRKKE